MTELKSKIQQLTSLTLEIQELTAKKNRMARNLYKFRQLISRLENSTIQYGNCELYFTKEVIAAHENYMTTQINEMTDALEDRESRIALMLKDH